MNTPIIFTFFTNPKDDLNPQEEDNGIQNALLPLKDIQHLSRREGNV